MARKKEYEREKVLEKAMKLFWKKGYEATSMDDIVKTTGLNRYGMYEAFGSKSGLFLAVLEKYQHDVTSGMFKLLDEEPLGLATIEAFFSKAVDFFSRAGSAKGCLFINTAIDLPIREKAAAKRIEKHMENLRKSFYNCLQKAAQKKELKARLDKKAAALYLVGIVQGFGVMARVGADREELRGVVKVALGGLSRERITAGAYA